MQIHNSRLVQFLSVSFLPSPRPARACEPFRASFALPRACRNVYDQGEIKSTAKILPLIRVYALPFFFRHCARVNTRKRLHWIRNEREHLTDGSLKGLWNRLTLLQRSSICLVYSAFTAPRNRSMHVQSFLARGILGIGDDSPCWFRWTFQFCWNRVLHRSSFSFLIIFSCTSINIHSLERNFCISGLLVG